MYFRYLHLVWSSVLLYIAGMPAYAAPVSELPQLSVYEEKLKQAASDFKQGDFKSAKQFYKSALEIALRDGEKVSAIYYNLGSVCYRLQQYDESRSYFKQLTDHNKLDAIAYYNLALIENKLSHKQSAIDYFYKSKQRTTDEKLSGLIDNQLLKLSNQKPDVTITKTVKDWNAFLYVSQGYDSNVTFSPLEVGSEQSGNFLQAIGLFDKRIAGEGYGVKKSALLVTSTIFISNYYSTSFNDYNLFDIGLRYLYPVDKWRNRVDLNLKKSTYGDRDYQKIVAATFQTKRKLVNNDVIRFRYRYEDIESLEQIYDYLTGNKQRASMAYQFRWPKDSLLLWYELEMNQRNNTIRSNFSPTRNTLRLRYQKNLNKRSQAYLELAARSSDYEPTATQDREDERGRFLLAYRNQFVPDWQVEARWSFTDNRSTEPVYSYRRHIVLLTLRMSL